MREFKFRAWDRETKQMFIVFTLEFPKKHVVYCFKGSTFIRLKYNSPIMQWTSLQDKNGKDIYEGDIVNLENELFRIVFKHGSFNLEDKKITKIYSIDEFSYRPDIVEVMGNIFENKELLEVKS